jgi:hypothetical protein
MEKLKPKRWNLWVRLQYRLSLPLTITITPIRWAPAIAVLVAAVLLVPSFSKLPTQTQMDGVGNGLANLSFSLRLPEASTVALLGSFNAWNPTGYQMKKHPGSGLWAIDLQVPPGRYEYAFLVNGDRIVSDPNAHFKRKDGFGDFNAIVFAESQVRVSL